MVTRTQVQKIATTIEAIAERLDPSPRQALIIIDSELDELLGFDATELVYRRHLQLFPGDARAKSTVILRTGSSRSEPRGKCDQASGQLLRELKARLQRPLALPAPHTTLQ